MPSAEEILRQLQGVCQEGRTFSPFIRLVFLALVAIFIWKRKLYPAYLAAFVALVVTGAAMISISFREYPNLFNFAVLFPVGLLWGREALILPPRPKISLIRLAAASALGLVAFFYPHFTDSVWGAVFFAPVGLAPCPTLMAAVAAIILTKRSYSLYAGVPTWVAALFYGLVGVFYLGVRADWVLVVAAPVSACLYFLSPAEAPPSRTKRSKRRR